MYAPNARTGAKLWSYNTHNAGVYSAHAVADGVVYIGMGDEKMYAFGLK